MKNRKVTQTPEAAESARKAMNKRNRKNVGDPNMPYYYVLGGFGALMIVIILYYMLNPKESFLDKQVVDQNEFMINNLHNQMFTAGPNEQFEGYTMNEARRFFNIGISETPNMNTCPPKDDVAIPDEYDFTKDPKHQHCVDTEVRATGNCTAGHVLSVISTVEDRICIQGKEGDRFRLSAQDAISCDSNNFYCDGGYVTQALEYGTKYGYVKEECFPYEGKNTTCPVDPNQ